MAAKTNNLRGGFIGFVLIEMLVALAIVALLTSIAMLSFSATSGNMYFRRKANDLISVLQTAVNNAQQSDRRYKVILDFEEQLWILQEIMPSDADVFAEEDTIIKSGYFDERFVLDYILYDDRLDTRVPREGEITLTAKLIAGHSGWQNGGKIVLRDEDGNPWSIVFYRIGKPAELFAGDVDIFLAQETKDMQF